MEHCVRGGEGRGGEGGREGRGELNQTLYGLSVRSDLTAGPYYFLGNNQQHKDWGRTVALHWCQTSILIDGVQTEAETPRTKTHYETQIFAPYWEQYTNERFSRWNWRDRD